MDTFISYSQKELQSTKSDCWSFWFKILDTGAAGMNLSLLYQEMPETEQGSCDSKARVLPLGCAEPPILYSKT